MRTYKHTRTTVLLDNTPSRVVLRFSPEIEWKGEVYKMSIGQLWITRSESPLAIIDDYEEQLVAAYLGVDTHQVRLGVRRPDRGVVAGVSIRWGPISQADELRRSLRVAKVHDWWARRMIQVEAGRGPGAPSLSPAPGS